MSGTCEGLGSATVTNCHRNKDCVSKQPPLLLEPNTQERSQSLAEGAGSSVMLWSKARQCPAQGSALIPLLGTSLYWFIWELESDQGEDIVLLRGARDHTQDLETLVLGPCHCLREKESTFSKVRNLKGLLEKRPLCFRHSWREGRAVTRKQDLSASGSLDLAYIKSLPLPLTASPPSGKDF